MTCELVGLQQGTFQIDQRGHYHHHIEHGSMDGLEETSRETITRSLKDRSVKEQIGGDETDGCRACCVRLLEKFNLL